MELRRGNALDPSIEIDAPVLVVLGNPPYRGHSADPDNRWMTDLLRGVDATSSVPTHNYFEVDGQPLGERNVKWLHDDYVRFIRFGQWRIEKAGAGILAYVTNHGYLDNPTFRGMRRALMRTFDEIRIVDLHGNARKGGQAPDGSKDESIFDIQQGVSIGVFVRRVGHRDGDECRVLHSELWGARERKLSWLAVNDKLTTPWTRLTPKSPAYLFVPQHENARTEWEQARSLTEAMPVHSVGIATARDRLTVHWSKAELWRTIQDFASLSPEEARADYGLGSDAQDWRVEWAQADVRASGPSKSKARRILYRPFDVRWTYYTGKTSGFLCRPRAKVMRHLLPGTNLALVTSRMTKGEPFAHALATRLPCDVICLSPRTSNNGFLFPLWLHEGEEPQANLAPDFLEALNERLGMGFLPFRREGLCYCPEDVFFYIYAWLHAPSYRRQFEGFLAGQFPRVPLPAGPELFRELCARGEAVGGTAYHGVGAVEHTRDPVGGPELPGGAGEIRGMDRAVVDQRREIFRPGHAGSMGISNWRLPGLRKVA